jgi:hypothetical protein
MVFFSTFLNLCPELLSVDFVRIENEPGDKAIREQKSLIAK